MEQASGDSADIAPRHTALRRCIVCLAVYYAVVLAASSVWMVCVMTFAGPPDPAERLVFAARFGLVMLPIGGLLVLVIWYLARTMLRFVSWLSAREERGRSATAGLLLVRIAVLLLLAQPVLVAIAGMTIFATICVGGCTGPAEPPPGGSSAQEVRTLDVGGGAELALVSGSMGRMRQMGRL